MSDPVPNLVVAENPTQPPVVYEQKEFSDGDFKGFKYFVPVHHTIESAAEAYGMSTILALINAQVVSRIRTKVKNDLGVTDKKPHEVNAIKTQLLAKNGGLLFTEADAQSWKPDVRELSPKALMKKATELFAEGKIAEGTELLKKAQAILTEEAEMLIASQQASPGVVAA